LVPVIFWKKMPPIWPTLPMPEVPCVALSGLFFQPGDQLRQIAGRRALARHDQQRIGRYQGDRGEIRLHMVGEAVDRAVGDVRAPDPRHQGVAVGRGFGDPRGGKAPGGAGHILDDKGLAKMILHLLGDDAGRGVDRPAGGKGNHDGDRTRRIGLGRRFAGGKHRGEQGQSLEHSHVMPP